MISLAVLNTENHGENKNRDEDPFSNLVSSVL